MALHLRRSLSFTLSTVMGRRYWLGFGTGSSGRRTDMHAYRHTDLLRQYGDFWHLETPWDLVTRPYRWRQRQALKERLRLIQQLQIKAPQTFKDVSKNLRFENVCFEFKLLHYLPGMFFNVCVKCGNSHIVQQHVNCATFSIRAFWARSLYAPPRLWFTFPVHSIVYLVCLLPQCVQCLDTFSYGFKRRWKLCEFLNIQGLCCGF